VADVLGGFKKNVSAMLEVKKKKSGKGEWEEGLIHTHIHGCVVFEKQSC
jgi:hypothetical protein